MEWRDHRDATLLEADLRMLKKVGVDLVRSDLRDVACASKELYDTVCERAIPGFEVPDHVDKRPCDKYKLVEAAPVCLIAKYGRNDILVDGRKALGDFLGILT